MSARRQDREARGDGPADMEERKAVDRDIMLVESVDLREGPGRMDLIAVCQPDKLWTTGCAARMKKRANPRPVAGGGRFQLVAGVRLKRAQIGLTRFRRRQIAYVQHDFETWDALQNGLHLLGSAGVAVESRHDQRRRALGDKQFRDGINAEKVVDRAGDTDDLSPK